MERPSAELFTVWAVTWPSVLPSNRPALRSVSLRTRPPVPATATSAGCSPSPAVTATTPVRDTEKLPAE